MRVRILHRYPNGAISPESSCAVIAVRSETLELTRSHVKMDEKPVTCRPIRRRILPEAFTGTSALLDSCTTTPDIYTPLF